MTTASRHMLAAVSDEPSALHGIRFLSRFLRPAEDIAVTLLFVAPRPPRVANAGRLLTAALEKGTASLDKAENLLVEAGFAAGSIERKNLVARRAKALEIMAEARRGLYDAVVLGRRGHSWLLDFVEGSVSRELMESGLRVPLWVARMPEDGRRGVLACVDDSPQSLGMVDHLGYVLGPDDQHITLLNVFDPGTEDRVLATIVFDRCMHALAEHGVEVRRIHTKTVASYTPARAILEQAATGGFAAVGVGRTGEGRGLAKRLFMGSVSRTLLEDLTGAALIVHQ